MFALSYWLICLAVVTSAIKWHLIREPLLNLQSFHRIVVLMMRASVHLRFLLWRAATEYFSLSNGEDEAKATRQNCFPCVFSAVVQAAESGIWMDKRVFSRTCHKPPRHWSPTLNEQFLWAYFYKMLPTNRFPCAMLEECILARATNEKVRFLWSSLSEICNS